MRIFFCLISLVCSLGLSAKQLQFHIEITNNWNKPQFNFPVNIKLKDVPGLDFEVKSANVILDADKKLYAISQLDDMNGDNHFDELSFEMDVDVKVGESVVVTVQLSDKASIMPSLSQFSFAEMLLDDKKGKHPVITALEAPGDSYLYNDVYHHGAAFENQLCAFRVYFDERQNIDIYGKQHRQLELATTHFYSSPEQMKAGYGNDVLWAGKSIACGSFKGLGADGTPENLKEVKTRGQRIIASGPVRTVVEVRDLGWKLGRSELNMRQHYILYASHRELEVQICFDRPLGDEQFCTGVQFVGNQKESYTDGKSLVATWGSAYPEQGKEEIYPEEAVGLAVYVPNPSLVTFIGEGKTGLNNEIHLQAKGKQEFKYYVAFAADKECPITSSRHLLLIAPTGYHNARSWFDALPEWKAILEHPCTIKIQEIK